MRLFYQICDILLLKKVIVENVNNIPNIFMKKIVFFSKAYIFMKKKDTDILQAALES